MNKFYNFVTTDNEVELFLNGAIVGGSEKTDENDVVFNDFKTTLDSMSNGSTLKLNISSPGGDVMATQNIMCLLSNAKTQKNIKIESYITLGASCASWLPTISDKMYVYENNSMIMLHLPYCFTIGNRNELSKEIDLLTKIETQMIGNYMSKVKDGVTEDQLRNMLEEETWLTGEEFCEIFDAEILPTTTKMVACADMNVLNEYKNIPENIKLLMKGDITMDDNKEPISNASTTTIKNELSQEDIRVELRKQLVDGLGVDKYDIWISGSMVYDSFFIYEIWSSTNEEYEYYKATFNRQGDVIAVDIENIEKVERKTVWITADESEVLVNEKVTIINELTSEKESIQAKYNEVSETVINLNTQISNLKDKADKYDEHILNEKVNEAVAYYQDKFEGLNAKAKFESEEVQILIKNSISDMDSKMKLNEMLLNLVPKATKVENKTEKVIKEQVKEVKNLLPNKPKSFEERYGL